MSPEIILNGERIEIKVVDSSEAESVLTPEEIAMDKAIKLAVSQAIERAEVLGLPIAGYDEIKMKAYTRYPNGEKVYSKD